VAVMAV